MPARAAIRQRSAKATPRPKRPKTTTAKFSHSSQKRTSCCRCCDEKPPTRGDSGAASRPRSGWQRPRRHAAMRICTASLLRPPFAKGGRARVAERKERKRKRTTCVGHARRGATAALLHAPARQCLAPAEPTAGGPAAHGGAGPGPRRDPAQILPQDPASECLLSATAPWGSSASRRAGRTARGRVTFGPAPAGDLAAA